MHRKILNNRLIINADDCGRTKEVDIAIKKCIESHCLSSTTIMANMYDFEGALELYNSYKEVVSFGCHLNLTEGTPLTSTPRLLDIGYVKQDGNTYSFNGRSFWGKALDKEALDEICIELDTQIQKILDSGVKPSHFDSHHHIHTELSITPIVSMLANKYNIKKIRGIENIWPLSLSLIIHYPVIWRYNQRYYKKINGFLRPNFFTSFQDYHDYDRMRKNNTTIELMCHPGHESEKYQKEMDLMLNTSIEDVFGDTLITYNQL